MPADVGQTGPVACGPAGSVFDRITLPDDPLAAIRRYLSCLTHRGPLLVAVSGGSDSLGLLLALHQCLSTNAFPGVSLQACTVDHGLRAESLREAQGVAALCAGLAIPHSILTWTGDKPVTGLQAAARLARYRLLADHAVSVGAVCVLTGHTLDDQRETIAMRASRSADPDARGLAGMAPSVLLQNRVWLHRPLLGVSRAEIRQVLEGSGMAYVEDPANSDSRFERARLRAAGSGDGDVTPEDIAAAAIVRRATSRQAAALLRDHVRIVEGQVAVLGDGLILDPAGEVALSALVACLGGRAHGPGADSKARILQFLRSGQMSRLTAGGVVFDRRREGLFVYRETRGLPTLRIEPGQSAVWDGRYRIENRSHEPILAAPAGAAADPAALVAGGIPERVAKRAAPAALSISSADGGTARDSSSQEAGSALDCSRIIAAYDWFLPSFDITLARELGRQAGTRPWPDNPVSDDSP